MRLSDKEIRFIEDFVKSRKEVKDMVGMVYKQKVRQYIKDKKAPRLIKTILTQMIQK